MKSLLTYRNILIVFAIYFVSSYLITTFYITNKQENFRAEASAAAENAVNSASKGIVDLVKNLESSLSDFTQVYQDEIGRLVADDVLSQADYVKFEDALSNTVPGIKNFSFFNKDLSPLLAGKESVLTQECRRSLKKNQEGLLNEVHIDETGSHLDFYSVLNVNQAQVIFFAQVDSGLIVKTLRKYERADLQLLILDQVRNELIIFTPDEALNNLHSNWQLSFEEKELINAKNLISGLDWLLVSYPKMDHILRHQVDVVSKATHIALLLALFGIAALFTAILMKFRIDRDEQVYNLAHFDKVTGLPNEVLLKSRFEISLGIRKRNEGFLSVVVISFENLNKIPEKVKQSVFKKLGATLKNLRDTDTAARFSENEFVIVLGEISAKDDAAFVAKKIATDIDDILMESSVQDSVRSVLGVAIFPDHGDQIDTLIENAHIAIDKAKKTNNKYHIYDGNRSN